MNNQETERKNNEERKRKLEEEWKKEDMEYYASCSSEELEKSKVQTKGMYKERCKEMTEQESMLESLQDKVMKHNRDIEDKRGYSGAQVRPSEELDIKITEIREKTDERFTTLKSFISFFKDDTNTAMRQKMLKLNDRTETHVSITNRLQEFATKNKDTNPNLENEVKELREKFSPILEQIGILDTLVQVRFQFKPSLIDDFADVSTEPMDPTGGDD